MVGPELINGALLLVALVALQGYLLRVSSRSTASGQIASGLLFGFMAIATILIPIVLPPGVRLDVHTVIVGVGAFWGGPAIGAISAALAAGFQILNGGSTFPASALAIVSVALTGFAFRHFLQHFHLPAGPIALFLFGGVAQVSAVLCILFVEAGPPTATFYQTAIFQLLLFPPATMAVCLLLADADRRFHALRALQASETRFRDLADSSGDFFFEQNADGILTTISERFEEIAGIPKERVEGRLLRRLIDWDAPAPGVSEALSALSEQRPFKDIEIPLRLGDARQLWLRASAHPVVDKNGVFCGFRGAATNITSQVWERNTLAERERRLNALYDNMQEGLAVFQLVRNRMGEFIDYRIIDANPAFEKQTGLVRESAIGRLASLVYGTGKAPHLNKYGRVAVSGQPTQFGDFFETLGRHLTISAFDLDHDIVVSVFRDATDSVRSIEKLRASEARFRDFADCSADWFFEQNADGALTFLSDRFEQIIGIQKAHFLGKNLVDLIDWEGTPDETRRAFSQNRPIRNAEALLKLPNGQTKWIRVSANPLSGNDGKFFGYRGTATEISAEKEIQAAIVTERDRARLYLEMAGTIMLVLERDGTIREVNRKGQEVLGQSRENLIGRNWFDTAIPKEDAKRMREIQSIIMSGNLESVEHVDSMILTKSGESRMIAWTNSCIEDSDGQILATISSGEDITERRKTESALAESERRLATLMSNLPGMAYRCLFDRNWSMEFVSSGVEKLTGYRAEDILGGKKISYAKIIHSEDRDRVYVETEEAVQAKAPFNYTYRISTAKGELRWVWEQGRAIYSDDGQPIALEGFISDITERIEFENALQQSEEHFRKMFETSSDAMVLRSDAAGIFEDANQAALELYGYTREEFLQLTPMELTAEPDMTHLAIKRLRGDGRLRMDIRLHRKKDGTSVPVELNVWTFTLGGATKYVAAMRDISDRVAAETALRESEARFRAILEASPSSIFLKDSDRRYVLANPAFCSRVGMPLADIIGKHARDLRSPDTAEVLDDHDCMVLETGEQKTIEVTVRERDAETHTYLTTKYPIVDAYGSISGLACVSTDISGRIRAEAALAESESKFRTIIETVLEGVWEIDATGKTQFVNDRLLEMLGYKRKEMIGRSFLEFMDDHWKEIAAKQLDRRRDGISDRHTFKFQRKDGSDLWAMVSTAPKLDASGRLESAVALVTDTTQQHHLNTKIRELEDHLSHVSRITQAGELATSFAHQLNQPLAAAGFYAQGLLDQLERGKFVPEEVKTIVATINDQMRRASEAISRIRKFVRRRKTTLESVVLNDVVREVIDLLRTDLQRFETEIQTRLSSRSPIVQGDPILLQQVLINLARNAAEALMEVEPRNRRIAITTSINRRDEVVMRVRDHGPGLSEDIQKHLFETFYTTKPEGLGMGLAICHTIVESHDGKIRARNHRSGGAVFEVIIPSSGGSADG